VARTQVMAAYQNRQAMVCGAQCVVWQCAGVGGVCGVCGAVWGTGRRCNRRHRRKGEACHVPGCSMYVVMGTVTTVWYVWGWWGGGVCV